MRNQTILVDINKETCKILKYKQYDNNNILQIIVEENYKKINLNEYVGFAFFELPSGLIIKKGCEIEDNVITIIIDNNVLSEEGKVLLDLTLSDGEDIFTLFRINLVIEETIDRDEAIIIEAGWDIVAEIAKFDKAEEQRVANEERRVDYESVRIENEADRQNEEMKRIANESVRVVKESERLINEQGRVNAEELRIENEELRVEAETSRVTTEEGRVEAENIRAEFYEGFNEQLTHINNNNIRTPQHYGAKGNGSDDDSVALYDAIVDCANNGYVLFLNGKYRVSTNIIYNAWRPVTIIGSRGTYPSLTSANMTRQNESYDIFFDNGATLEINKFGCVTFQNVGFASDSKESGTGIIVKSFRNKFSQCSFSQMEKAIHIMEGSHWVGENQILYCEFVKCGYAIYADDGVTSDSEVIGNLIHGTCDVGFYGACAGFTFSLNHFYNRQSSYFKYFNTKITDNYIQETQNETPSIILNGSYGCILSDNNFELNNADPRTNKMGLVGIELRNGGGNLTITGNAVHGKDIKAVQNLAFIDLIYTDTKYDMPIHFDGNNTRCCSGIFTEYYPLYNLKGGISLKTLPVTQLGGNISEQTVEVINGIAHFHVIMDSIPSYANLFKLSQYLGIPFQYTMIQTLNNGTTNTFTKIGTSSTISISNYAQVTGVEVVGSYVVNHSSQTNFYLE